MSGDRAVSCSPRSYLAHVVNNVMATADNRHVLGHSGIMKTLKELKKIRAGLLYIVSVSRDRRVYV
jgi:hypothetical protein